MNLLHRAPRFVEPAPAVYEEVQEPPQAEPAYESGVGE